MKILFMPSSTNANPYQIEIAKAAEKYGASISIPLYLKHGKVKHGSKHAVKVEKTSRLSILRAVKSIGRLDILHFHWIEIYFKRNTCLRTILAICTFVFQVVILRLRGIKVVWTVHNIVGHESLYPAVENFAYGLTALLCNGIIAHCEYAKEAILKKYCLPQKVAKKIYVIPHANYVADYPKNMSRNDARKRLNLRDMDRIFLNFGKLRGYKGITSLIQAYKSLNCENTILIIAGKPVNDQILARLEQACRDESGIVLHARFIPDNEIQVYMNAADVVVLPFNNILTSGSVVLAASFSKPVIAPRLGCIPEVICDEGGLLYHSDDPLGLYNSMQRALKLDLNRIGRANFENIKHLSWSLIANNTCEVYKNCLKNASY